MNGKAREYHLETAACLSLAVLWFHQHLENNIAVSDFCIHVFQMKEKKISFDSAVSYLSALNHLYNVNIINKMKAVFFLLIVSTCHKQVTAFAEAEKNVSPFLTSFIEGTYS